MKRDWPEVWQGASVTINVVKDKTAFGGFAIKTIKREYRPFPPNGQYEHP